MRSKFKVNFTRMYDVYEYRQSGRSQVVWLSAAVVAFLLAFGIVNDAPDIIVLVWCLAGAMLVWMLIVSPIRGGRSAR